MKKVKTYGAEIEKVVSSKINGASFGAGPIFFKNIEKRVKKRENFVKKHISDLDPKVVLGIISSDLGEQGLDNGFNLLETSLVYQNSLKDLYAKMLLDLKTTQESLSRENASVINFSIHPFGKRDLATYKKFVAPKGVYKYLFFRGWDHTAGIDARAQNSPTTGVNVYQAADAVSVIIGAGAAFIALFGNGPFEEGKISQYKEVRATMWERMMKNSKVEGDRTTSSFPKKRFRTLAQYFTWMFGGKTGIHFVIEKNREKNDYKGGGNKMLIIEGNPPVLTYLYKKKWKAKFLQDALKGNKKFTQITPDISHMESMQFAQFAGARIRYQLNTKNFPLKEFLSACKKLGKTKVEEIFNEYANFVYIEGRDPGANFPDSELHGYGDDIALSTIIAPSAIQAGLLQNLGESVQFIDSFKWNSLNKLRETAIKNGLQGTVDGISVYDFTKRIYDIAIRGLSKNEQKFLLYPKFVLETKQNGADRALRFLASSKKKLKEALRDLVKQRQIKI